MVDVLHHHRTASDGASAGPPTSTSTSRAGRRRAARQRRPAGGDSRRGFRDRDRAATDIQDLYGQTDSRDDDDLRPAAVAEALRRDCASGACGPVASAGSRDSAGRAGWQFSMEFVKLLILKDAPVAQLDRASASGAEGHRFESCRARQPQGPFSPKKRAFSLGFACFAHEFRSRANDPKRTHLDSSGPRRTPKVSRKVSTRGGGVQAIPVTPPLAPPGSPAQHGASVPPPVTPSPRGA